MSDNTILDYNQNVDESPYGHLPLASNGSRFVNYLLDSVFAVVTLFIGLLIVGIIVSLVLGTDLESTQPGDTVELLFLLVFFGLYFGYYIFMEYYFEGRTLAKMITKTRVVTTDGYPISLGQAFGRTFSRLIPFDRYSILFGHGTCWHDSIPGTIVVQE